MDLNHRSSAYEAAALPDLATAPYLIIIIVFSLSRMNMRFFLTSPNGSEKSPFYSLTISWSWSFSALFFKVANILAIVF